MKKILIIEDDEHIRDELSKILMKNSYVVDYLVNFDQYLETVSNGYHVILLDITLPVENGFELCKNIKKVCSTPIIFVTSSNTEEMELKSILSGGDDFISKPYNTSILLEKIRRVVNRDEVNKTKIFYKNVILDLADSTVSYGEKKVELTRNEKKIMMYFFEHPNQVIEKEMLLEYLWNEKDYLEETILLVSINRLRKKLEEIDLGGFIITIRGRGYQI